MIFDLLIPEMKKRFPNAAFQVDTSSYPTITIPYAYPAFGDVRIHDDVGEATVVIGNITHSHFNPYEPSFTQTQIDQAVTDSVIEFLEALFSDKILLWVDVNGQAGGWRWLEFDAGDTVPLPEEHCQFYVWSGPAEPNHLREK